MKASGNRRRWRKALWLSLLLLWVGTGLWHTNKPLINGAHINSAPVLLPEGDVRLLTDLTWRSPAGQRISEQTIFDAALAQIDAAQRFIVLDFFLINDDMGDPGKALRPLSRQLADHLLARKLAVPHLEVLVVTDPINDVYGGAPSALLAELQAAGIHVVRTDLRALRDSNPGYSALWRMFVQWFGNSAGGHLPNPFDGEQRISLRSWLSLLNFKANHRKVLVSDDVQDGKTGWVALVTSANPHDASSAHSNIAVQFRGDMAKTVFDSEVAVAKASGWSANLTPTSADVGAVADGTVELSYVTEGAILERVVQEVNATQSGDRVRMAMFYLSERRIITALKRAAQRDVSVQLILDPNKDAFGIEKDGVPNRPVANELVTSSPNVEVRWYRTSGEQFHTKLMTVERDGRLFATVGSANFTRRNLADYNLEANVALDMPATAAIATQLQAGFTRLWQGDAANPEYTAPFAAYRDDSRLRYWRYRLMEATGLSTF